MEEERKEFTKRVSDALEEGDVELNALQNAFMNIATAKVALSAEEAREMGILRNKDRISVNKDRQILDAKSAVIELSDAGYTMPAQAKNIKVQGRAGLALFMAGVHGMRMGNYISDHDKKIALKIANVMCGGDLTSPQEVSEQYLLDLGTGSFCFTDRGKENIGKNSIDFNWRKTFKKLIMDAYIVAAKRTANTRAKKGGFRFTRPDDFATEVIKALVQSVPGLENKMVDDLIVGNAVQEAEQGMQMGRMIALTALGIDNAGMVINRYCGSGVEAIHLPLQKFRPAWLIVLLPVEQNQCRWFR